MKRHVRIRGAKVPVERRKLKAYDGLAYQSGPRRRIVLNRRLRGVQQLSTLVREMIHQAHLGFSERTVLRLEESIVEMILENPEVFHNRLWKP